MLHFATLFDKNYLSRGLALYESLQKQASQLFTLFVLALDEVVVSYFATNPGFSVKIIQISDLERYYPDLLTAKQNRSKIEYYFTLSPFLPSYILEKYSHIDRITTLDCDLYFFDDPNLIFAAYPDASILITPHNFTERLSGLIVHGRYNVSFQSFKNDKNALNCLTVWRSKCVEWCYDSLDLQNNRYADQKYLDSWGREFDKVADIEIAGTGIAPWNLDKHVFSIKQGKVFVNSKPLIYYHFHHLRVFNTYFAINAFRHYQVKKIGRGVRKIYHFYLNRLAAIARDITFTDREIVRYGVTNNKNLVKKLLLHDGYWFFSKWFIIFINPSKKISIVKNIVRKIYGSIVRSRYVHR